MKHPERTLRSLLYLDAAACLALAAVGLVFTAWLLDELGLQVSWPILATRLFLAVYGVAQVLVARQLVPRVVVSLVVIDGLFAVGVLSLAIFDLADAAPWVRWALVALGLGVGAFGLAKRQLIRAVDTSANQRSSAATRSWREQPHGRMAHEE